MQGDFTPTQLCMLNLLADGMLHTRRELHTCLPDELGRLSNIKPHLSTARKRLAPLGKGIECVIFGGKIYYRLVSLSPASIQEDD